MFGIGDGDAAAVCGVCSALAVKTPGQHHWLWAWLAPCSGVSVVEFGQLNAG